MVHVPTVRRSGCAISRGAENPSSTSAESPVPRDSLAPIQSHNAEAASPGFGRASLDHRDAPLGRSRFPFARSR